MDHPVNAHGITWAAIKDWVPKFHSEQELVEKPFSSYKFHYLKKYHQTYWPDCLDVTGHIDWVKYDALQDAKKISRYINHYES